MSSAPSQDQKTEKAPAPAPAGRPPERKAAAGPVITPQVLAIAFGLIFVIGVIVYYQMVIVKTNNELQGIEGQITATETKIATYTKKQGMLEQAREVNLALREKLKLIGYLFLVNQDTVLPFYEETLLPIIEASKLVPGPDTFIAAEEYLFKINMAMDPFETLPRVGFFDDPIGFFPIDYLGEKNGQVVDTPLDTMNPEFLHPYQIELGEWLGRYEDAQTFVESLQTAKDDILITVHCLTNDEGSNAGLFRTTTSWSFKITVYFMNPEASTSGDTAPGMPGSESC